MTYSSKPWTVEVQDPKTLRAKKRAIQIKEIQSRMEENVPVSVMRVVKFLDKNKNQTYTNRQIAKGVGISGSLTSSIMDKLEEIGYAKIVKIRKNLSGISQVYQSSLGASTQITKEREVEGDVVKVLSMFKSHVNKTYTKKELMSKLDLSGSKVGQALQVLLATGEIKAIGIKDNSFVYQSSEGNKVALDISSEPNEKYITLGHFLKIKGITDIPEGFKEKLSKGEKHSRLFYSNKGVVREYKISYLQKSFEQIFSKKGLIEKEVERV